MATAVIAGNRQAHLRRWLRLYLDFCHKYQHDSARRSTLAALSEKLQAKERAVRKRQQACEAATPVLGAVGAWRSFGGCRGDGARCKRSSVEFRANAATTPYSPRSSGSTETTGDTAAAGQSDQAASRSARATRQRPRRACAEAQPEAKHSAQLAPSSMLTRHKEHRHRVAPWEAASTAQAAAPVPGIRKPSAEEIGAAQADPSPGRHSISAST